MLVSYLRLLVITISVFVLAHAFVLYLEKILLQRKLKHALSVNGEKKLVFPDGTSTFLDAWLDESQKSPDGRTYPYGKAWNYHGVS